MKLIECYIENFGKLTDFKYSFSPGLNTIKQDNGYGKTTLTMFIKAMLYGLDDTRRARLESNDRKHYLPWNGGRCAGSLIFETDEKKYRIERCFMPRASEDTFMLYDVKTGKPSEDFSSNVGEELFGIDQDGFLRTVFLSEINLSGKNENKSISAKLSDLVGCDGDIGVMDEALELLENQRKIYRKRGGTGEIGDIKKRVGELERRIHELERMEEDFLLEEKELASIKASLAALYEKRRESEEKNRLLNIERLKKNYEKQYLGMKAAVNEEEEKLNSLSGFFKNGVPTQTEVEKAREMASSAKVTLSEITQSAGGELSELEDFFACGATEEEIKNASELSALEARLRADAERAKRDAQERAERADKLPSCSPGDLDSLTKEIILSKKVNRNWQILIPLGILTAVLLVGIFLLAVGIKGYKAEKSSLTLERARERAFALLGDSSLLRISNKDELLERLYAERALSLGALQLREECNMLLESSAALAEKADRILSEMYEFIAKFPLTDAKTPSDAISDIARRHAIYKALLDSRAAADKRREEQILDAKSKERAAFEFISRFPTLSERPYDEVAARLLEYNSLLRSLERMRASLSEFAAEHKIDTGALEANVIETLPQVIDTEELEAKILDFERAGALSERRLKALSDELDEKDGLCAERDELIAREKEYEARLSVILKTVSFLEEAKDNLTSRYLSGTKAAFDKYVSAMGLESGEDFTMDTSFTVMKNERGTLRQTEAYSRGTRELYALSARLALVDSLYEMESPFIILDDPFAYFDDEKLSRALSVIKEASKDRQIIYLTCSGSRKI